MGMPLDLYVIRHGESEANVIISAGEQGDNSLYTQDNVTVPDRSWRLTATGRKQADCIGRWLVSQQPLFDRYLVSPYVRTRETAATMALPKAKWEETRVLRERSWGEINTITKDDFKTNYARNWMFKNTDPLYWRPPAGESIADVAENRGHNLLTSLNRKSDAESVVMSVTATSCWRLCSLWRTCLTRSLCAVRRPTNGRSLIVRASIIRAVIRRPGVRISGSVGSRPRGRYSMRRKIVGW